MYPSVTVTATVLLTASVEAKAWKVQLDKQINGTSEHTKQKNKNKEEQNKRKAQINKYFKYGQVWWQPRSQKNYYGDLTYIGIYV